MTSMRTLLAGTAFALAVAAGGQAAAVTINFDNLGNGVQVTNQYAEATFSSNPGFQILTTAQNLGSSLPNFICTGSSGSIDCQHDVFVAFTNPVSGLHFLATGANNLGVIAQVNVFTGGVFNSTVNITGTGNPFTPIGIDLSAFSNVTSIAIVNDIDAAGLGFDDFIFSVGGGVPEPSAWALMLLGFGGIGLAARRNRRAFLAA